MAWQFLRAIESCEHTHILKMCVILDVLALITTVIGANNEGNIYRQIKLMATMATAPTSVIHQEQRFISFSFESVTQTRGVHVCLCMQ